MLLATELATDPRESNLRTAVGRAYYAAFLFARENVGADDNTSAGVHKNVIDALTPKNMSDKLQQLLWLRKVADYELVPKRVEYYDWHANWTEAKRLSDLLITEFKRRRATDTSQ